MNGLKQKKHHDLCKTSRSAYYCKMMIKRNLYLTFTLNIL